VSALRREFVHALLAAALIGLGGCSMIAYDQARSKNTVEAYQTFLAKYPDCDPAQAADARSRIERLKWNEAVRKRTPEGFAAYLAEYPDSVAAKKQIEELDFAAATKANTLAAYRAFMQKHPEARKDEINKRILQLSKTAYAAAGKADTVEAYQAYLKDFGDCGDKNNIQSAQFWVQSLLGRKLETALKAKDYQAVEAILAQGLQKTDYRLASELRSAVIAGDMAQVERVIKWGVPVDNSSVIYACEAGKLEMLAKLLTAGGDIDGKGDKDQNPLVQALVKRKTEVVRLLLDKGANPAQADPFGATPLMAAASVGNAEFVKECIARKVDVNVQARVGTTALGYAAANGYDDIVSLLMAAGADPMLCKSRSPVEMARAGGHAKVVALLKQYSIHESAAAGDVEQVKALLDKGVKVDVADSEEHTALHRAAQAGKTDVMDLLIARGASLSAADQQACTPLHLAAAAGEAAAVKMLAQKGASLKAQDKKNRTPLEAAADEASCEAIGALIDAGADTACLFDANNRDDTYGITQNNALKYVTEVRASRCFKLGEQAAVVRYTLTASKEPMEVLSPPKAVQRSNVIIGDGSHVSSGMESNQLDISRPPLLAKGPVDVKGFMLVKRGDKDFKIIRFESILVRPAAPDVWMGYLLSRDTDLGQTDMSKFAQRGVVPTGKQVVKLEGSNWAVFQLRSDGAVELVP
jgi:ankyrin repeat protein